MPSRPRRALLLALVAALASCGGAPEPRASFLLITCDTLRADHLGFLGHSRPTSPNLDALAAESVVFEHAWSTAPLTGPALSALLTGRPPEELGLSDNRVWLGAAAETLAERARAAGIETAAIVSNWVLRKRERGGVQQGFEHFDDAMQTAEASRPDLKERLAADTTDAALAWLAGRDPERPFFLWVHYQDPHGPYTPPADCLAPFAPEPRGEPALGVGQDQKVRGALPPYQVVDDERRPEVYRQRYEAEIRAFDRELGRLLDELRKRGLLQTTTLAFTADHGESLGENGWWFSHGQTLQRELLAVPLLLRPPGGAAPARRESAPVSHLDLLPTALAALGLPREELCGLDLLSAPPAAGRVLPQFLRGSWSAVDATHRLVMSNGTPTLFELADVREERDLAAARPELVQALARAHRDFLQGRRRLPPLEPERAPRSSEEERVLEDLGYGGEDDD